MYREIGLRGVREDRAEVVAAQMNGVLRAQNGGRVRHHDGIFAVDVQVEADTPEQATTTAIETIDGELDRLGIRGGEVAWARQPVITEA